MFLRKHINKFYIQMQVFKRSDLQLYFQCFCIVFKASSNFMNWSNGCDFIRTWYVHSIVLSPVSCLFCLHNENNVDTVGESSELKDVLSKTNPDFYKVHCVLIEPLLFSIVFIDSSCSTASFKIQNFKNTKNINKIKLHLI